MKTIKLNSLTLQNFKGIRLLSINLNAETSIYGSNGTGKTTLFDAFTWLMFGKDSTGRTSFEIKTLDENNNVIPKIDHVVEAALEIDGKETKFKRTFREKWVKKRGALEAEFSGNETLYVWNDVEMTKRDYEKKIAEIINEDVFKLITNPKAFNELKWQDQRKALIEISGTITDEEIAAGDDDFESLLGNIENKTLEEYTQQIKSSIRKSKKEIKTIPTRIDEVQNGKPVPMDYSKIKKNIAELKAKLDEVDSQVADKNKLREMELKRQSDIRLSITEKEYEIKKLNSAIQAEVKSAFDQANEDTDRIKKKIDRKKDDVKEYEEALKRFERQKENIDSSLVSVKSDMEELRGRWFNENSKEFKMDKSETACPTCHRTFDSNKIEVLTAEAEKHFNDHKQKNLAKINEEGKFLKEELKNGEGKIEELVGRIKKGDEVLEAAKRELEFLKKELVSSGKSISKDEIKSKVEADAAPRIKAIQQDIAALKAGLEDTPPPEFDDLKKRRIGINQEIDKNKAALEEEKQIIKADKRIEELTKEEEQTAQTISDLERDLYVIERFTKAKIDLLESTINKRFDYVSFKLFETQVNGAEVETCKALINGVPFSDANTASKINAGIDIINTLSNHYGVTAPIFIDNRESVVNLIDCESQIINLFVSKKDKTLRVKSKVKELEKA